MKTTMFIAFSTLCMLHTGCPEETTPVDASDTTQSDSDAASPPQDGTTPSAACEAGFVNLTFSVDDSANKTYADGELLWTGSFAWEEAANTLTYSTSWLPNEGPYPPLYDDGPQSAGGHEPEGSAAGDHIFGTSVCYKPEEDKLFAYGLLNDELRWIWIGPNGQIEIKADAEGVVDVPGMTIAAHGDLDFKVFLELSALHPDYSTISLETHKVYVKGTMNSWTPVQLLDNGKLGDEVEGDGIVTYQHSALLGTHDGLMNPGQEAQFAFIFAMEGINPDDGQEYKVLGDAVSEGVSAQADCGDGWVALEPKLSLDSKGKSMNTAVVVCSGQIEPECSADKPCDEGFTCIDGECISTELAPPQLFVLMPNTGSMEGGTEVMLYGEHLKSNGTVLFGDVEAEILSGGGEELLVKTPAGPLGKVDVKVTTDAGETSFPDAFTYVEAGTAPFISSIEPNQGSTSGGTNVTIYGANFKEGALVAFGTAPAIDIDVAEDGTSITLTTPAHPAEAVPVKVTNPDGQGVTMDGGFTFTEKVADWGILEGQAVVEATAGDSVTLTGQVYEGGVTDEAGAGFSVSAEAGFGPAGSDPTGNDAWTWTAADYINEVGNNDQWSGSVTVPEGAWSATMRFSLNGGTSWLYVDLDGDDNGFQADNIHAIDAAIAEALNITSLSPNAVPTFGGQTVTLNGTGFDDTCTLTLDGTPTEVSVQGPEAATFIAPAHPAGSASVTLDCAEGGDTTTLAYQANWDGVLSEWSDAEKLATNELVSDWGDENTLNSMYAATDGEFLYVAIDGYAMGLAFGPNAVVTYIDTDLGAGTGVTDTSVLENNGAVDDALGGTLNISIDGFGAELAFATLNMATYDASENGTKGDAGWRSLTTPADLAWLLEGSVFTTDTGIEAFIPLTSLYDAPDGSIRNVGLVTKLGNGDGSAQSNQSLPAALSQAATLSFVY